MGWRTYIATLSHEELLAILTVVFEQFIDEAHFDAEIGFNEEKNTLYWRSSGNDLIIPKPIVTEEPTEVPVQSIASVVSIPLIQSPDSKRNSEVDENLRCKACGIKISSMNEVGVCASCYPKYLTTAH